MTAVIDPTDPTDAAERLPAFGRWLARERELRGLTRDQVVRVMKLAPGVIEALESGEEVRMPPRAYTVGYLRAYSAAVGLDADEVVLRYEEALGPGGDAPATADGRGGRALAAALILAALAGAAAWWPSRRG